MFISKIWSTHKIPISLTTAVIQKLRDVRKKNQPDMMKF